MRPEQEAELMRQVMEIEAFDRPGCIRRWMEIFGNPPPKYLSPQFMKRVLIWELQSRLCGPVSPKTERALARIAVGGTVPPRIRPGAHLVREWNGRTYQVEVVEGGFVMDGRTWRSLSALARHITGARWSGPRFFGLT